ncbi:DUF4390 domain-containing protein [Thermosulfurimonas sp. F29]|uniref:DUF4390 domain-containing protein n=1 Tax=Thermosulfurimonas sp. F29 TaxID=2867247 RepID=UPI001C840087|nr:DUF4390 domain-containing protein [Thermosulfurimonas sp. F29]MBX6423818.1 DUF4390 domain-containing protein [Thermosulfurimonas sp. F29]
MRGLAAFFLALFFLGASQALALRIRDLNVAPYRDYLLIYAYLEDLPWEDLKEALRHGLGLTFNFKIEVYRVRRLLRDEKFFEENIARTVYYDPVKNIYYVQTVGALESPRRATSPRQALMLAANLEGVPLFPLVRLKPGVRYRLKVRAEVRKITRVGWPKKIIRFLLFKGDTLESSWATLSFSL